MGWRTGTRLPPGLMERFLQTVEEEHEVRTMNPAVFPWIIYAFWITLVVYLTVSAIGVKRESQDTSGRVSACSAP